MSKESLNSHSRAAWRRLTVLGVMAVLIAVTAGGCCSWAAKHCSKDWGTPTIAFGPTKACDRLDCVCEFPDAVYAPPGGKVEFINTTHHLVTVDLGTANEFTALDGSSLSSIVVGPDESVVVRVSRTVHTGTSLGLNVKLPSGVTWCDGNLPGPRIDTDRP